MKRILLLAALIPSMAWSQCMLTPHTVTSDVSNVICQGPATIGIQSSDPFASYFLVANGTDTVQSWLQGDMLGGPISFNPTMVSSPTTYSVKARQQMNSKSLNFNGVDQGVIDPTVSIGTSYTIITWVNIQSLNIQYTPFVELGNIIEEDIWLGLQNGRLAVWMDDINILIDANPLPLNQWIPVAATYDGNTGDLTIMVNGNTVGTTNYIATVTSANELRIGYDIYNTYTNGSFDHVAVFNTAMQPSQINNYVYSCINPTTPGLVALYDFEEGLGNITMNAATSQNATVLNVDINSWFDGLWVCGPTCDLDMTNTVTVNVSNLPTEPFTAATSFFCNPSSATIFSPSSFAGADYYLIDDATSAVVAGPISGGGSVTFNTPVLNNTTSFSVHGEWIAPSTGLEVLGYAVNPRGETNFSDFTAETWFQNNMSHVYSSDLGITVAYDYDNVLDQPIAAAGLNVDASTGLPYIITTDFITMTTMMSSQGTTNILDGNWHHLALSRNTTSGTFTLFVNGVQEASTSAPTNPWFGGLVAGFDLATFSASVYGTYDDIRFWSEARSSVQIMDNMNDCLEGTEANLEGYWKLDDGSGSECANSAMSGGLGRLEVDNNAIEGSDFNWVAGYTTCTICENTVATVTVTVGDTEAPTFTCNNATISLDASGNASITAGMVVTGIADNCDSAPVVTLSKSAFDCSDLNNNLVTITVQDASGNSASCQVTVEVEDNISPVISNMPADMVVQVNTSDCGAIVNWTPPTFSDNCGVVYVYESDAPGSVFYLGYNEVEYEIEDEYGNYAYGYFSITVESDLSASATTTDATCYGTATGSIVVDVTGGNAPYTYYWYNDGSTDGNRPNVFSDMYAGEVTDADGCYTMVFAFVDEPSPIDMMYSYNDPTSCGSGDGEIDVTVFGGTVASDYSYMWSNGATTAVITGLTGGIYTLIATDDNGCQKDLLVALTEPNAPIIDLDMVNSVTETTCFGDSDGELHITVSLQGSATSSSTLWNTSEITNAITGLSAGMYGVSVVDDNGCTSANVYSIDQPSAVQVILDGSSNPYCVGEDNGYIDVYAFGGTVSSGYTYLWGGGETSSYIDDLTAGTYTVTATDERGCSASLNVVLTDPDPITATVFVYDVTCNGANDGSIYIIPTGGLGFGYSYEWDDASFSSSQNLTNVGPGTYNVEIEDWNGCYGYASGTVSEPDALVVTTTPTDITTGNNGAVSTTVTGGTAPYTYDWTGPGGFMSTDENLTGIGLMGVYEVTVTDDNGCSTTSSAIVNNTTGLATTDAISMNIYPNPSNGMFTVNSSISNGTIIVRDALGRQIHQQAINSTTNIVNLETQSNGIYFMELRNGELSKTVRVVVAR